MSSTGGKKEEKGGLQKGRRTAFPATLSPMLATLIDKPFDEDGWLYEIKWDGYRALAFCKKGEVMLKSRNDKSFDEKFYPVHDAMKQWKHDAIIDGEIVVLDESGKSDFGALQNWRSETDGELFYYAFDILWLDGMDLTQLPLTERKKWLESVMPQHNRIRLSESYDENGLVFFDTAKKIGLEGIMAKKAGSIYTPGIRTREWLKIKAAQRQEMVIGGYTINNDSPKAFSSLLLGVYRDGKLIYTGKAGTGYTEASQAAMMKLFRPLVTDKPPFSHVPDVNKPSRFRPNPPNATAVWLKPELVCEISYTEITRDGIMRHPSFEGMRTDKKAKDVTLETPMNTSKAVHATETPRSKLLKPAENSDVRTLLNPSEETQVKTIKGHQLKFSNLSKIYWPDEKISKRDMLNYYYNIAPYILPYLKDRPQSLNRYPNGIKGKAFYQKDITGKAPDWIKTYLYHTEIDPGDKHFLVATDEASLLFMASLGCIEMNPWSSTIRKPDNPDWCIIDLDPGKQTFDQVVEVARVTHDVLESLGVPSYPKTSGSTGMHIYIPLGAKYSYEQSKEFGRAIATMVHREIPRLTSIERIVKERKGKMYIDFLQNRPQATIASAYSLRPKPGATVSMPLHWEEVKKGLKMKDFTIHNALDRVRQEGDIFKPVLGKGVDLKKITKQFE